MDLAVLLASRSNDAQPNRSKPKHRNGTDAMDPQDLHLGSLWPLAVPLIDFEHERIDQYEEFLPALTV